MSQVCNRSQRRPTYLDLVPLLAAGLVIVVFRLHAYPAPLESDECNYAYFAQRMLDGDRLYVDLWDHQPPGIFALLLLPTAIFGSSAAVYRTLALLTVLLTQLGVFDLARRWFGRLGAGAAALLFALSSSDPGIAGEGCNREIYMNLLLVGAWWILARSAGGRLKHVFAAGLLIGLASTIKTVVALHWIALVPSILMTSAQEEIAGRAKRVNALVAFAAGPALVWFMIMLYFSSDGRMDRFVDAAFTYNLVYSSGEHGWIQRLFSFFTNANVFRTAWPLWVAGAAGLLAFPWRRGRMRALLMGGFVVGSYLAVCLPGKFWPHYFLLMLPPVVLLAAGLVQRIEGYQRPLAAGAALIVSLALLATQMTGYLLVDPDQIAEDRYRERMNWARDQAERVKSVTEPDDTIYMWGFDTGFYYYSGRRCASRYTMNTALIGDDPATAARRRLLLKDLMRNKPRLIVIPFSPQPPCPELVWFIQETRYVSVGRTKRMEILCDMQRPIRAIDWTWEHD